MGEGRERMREGGEGVGRGGKRGMCGGHPYSPVAFSHRMASLSFISNSLTSSV